MAKILSKFGEQQLVMVNYACGFNQSETRKYFEWIVYTTQVNSTFRARWLATSEVISQILFTSEQPKKNKVAFVGILSQKSYYLGR